MDKEQLQEIKNRYEGEGVYETDNIDTFTGILLEDVHELIAAVERLQAQAELVERKNYTRGYGEN